MVSLGIPPGMGPWLQTQARAVLIRSGGTLLSSDNGGSFWSVLTAGDPFGQTGALHGRAHRFLQTGCGHIMATLYSAARIDAAFSRREQLLPAQLFRCGSDFPGKTCGQAGLAKPSARSMA